MTPEHLQSEIDALFAEAQRLMADGESRAASHVLDIMRRLKGYLPQMAVPAPVSPVEAPEPDPAPVDPYDATEPRRRFRKSKGV